MEIRGRARVVPLVKRTAFEKGGAEISLLPHEVHVDPSWQMFARKQPPKGPHSVRWLIPWYSFVRGSVFPLKRTSDG